MTLFKSIVLIAALSFSFAIQAQEAEVSNETKMDKKSYYQKRAQEDAKFEQEFSAKTEAEEEAFWKEQKAYEKDLKRRDRKAHKAYMKGKRDAYAEHYEHCNHHCHHSDYYYHHATVYYYRYDGHYSHRYPRRNTVTTRINVSTPRIGLGLGI
ncbi:hypothetical protein [Hwangdonia seohaensis]|uniref:Uncharacterized protein n=1 Tax=Hwangdonia seohaensis TaxID=1240727 RepID=A0ABW3RFL8_9FLAO|nr:hypothetical protein [Hwangdonia seohaensis]